MLSVKTTENLAGVTVSGTYWDLNALYDALTNVIGEEESYPEFEACRIQGAYATCVRKALNGYSIIPKQRTSSWIVCRMILLLYAISGT